MITSSNERGMCTTFLSNPKESLTQIIPLEYGIYNKRHPCTKILVKLITGRRHQIRVHCAVAGHAILGDLLYSPSPYVHHIDRTMLHSYRLEMKLPDIASLEITEHGRNLCETKCHGTLIVKSEDPFSYHLNYSCSQSVRSIEEAIGIFEEML
ncbi:hypothetical protein GJ496_001996 [Pomphorhynchus laevis]|nr:hypothetical protein GJ496_001996 [Pomphorhynchus laevis]